MKNRTLRILGAALAALLLVFSGVQLYGYANPRIEIRCREMAADGVSLSLPYITVRERSLFGCSAAAAARMNEWTEKTDDMAEALLMKYRAPMEIASRVENTDGRTVVTYTGRATLADGESAEVSERLEFNYILTRRLP